MKVDWLVRSQALCTRCVLKGAVRPYCEKKRSWDGSVNESWENKQIDTMTTSSKQDLTPPKHTTMEDITVSKMYFHPYLFCIFLCCPVWLHRRACE